MSTEQKAAGREEALPEKVDGKGLGGIIRSRLDAESVEVRNMGNDLCADLENFSAMKIFRKEIELVVDLTIAGLRSMSQMGVDQRDKELRILFGQIKSNFRNK